MPPKRKSNATNDSAAKKARLNPSDHTVAAELINTILKDPSALSDDVEELKDHLITLAKYAQALKDEAAVSVPTVAQKTPEELENAAAQIRKAAQAGIKKQMAWRPSCKTKNAKWVYDGVCPDPEVFGILLELGGPPTFKQKKFTVEEFEQKMGRIRASARYSDLILHGSVNVRWPGDGTYKLSGTYGVH